VRWNALALNVSGFPGPEGWRPNIEEEIEMNRIKTLLAVVLALCLMMSLAVPAFATEATGDTVAVESTAAATEAVTEGSEAAAESTEAATEAATAGTTEAAVEGSTTTTGTSTAPKKVNVLQVILIIVEVIASIALVLVVLMQSGKESGLSGAIAGNSDSYMNKGNRATLDKKLASATKWIALVWILVTLALCLV